MEKLSKKVDKQYSELVRLAEKDIYSLKIKPFEGERMLSRFVTSGTKSLAELNKKYPESRICFVGFLPVLIVKLETKGKK